MILTEPVARYLAELHAPADPLLARMRAHGEREGIPIVVAETGALLELLASRPARGAPSRSARRSGSPRCTSRAAART